MAEKKEEKKEEGKAPEAPAAPKAPKGPLIIALLNTVGIVATLGIVVYAKLLFKRPPITEDDERARLEVQAEKGATTNETASIVFEPMTVNIQPEAPRSNDNPSAQPKLHYATFSFSLEVSGEDEKTAFDQIRPIFIDKIIELLGKKSFSELSTVQGRYLLRTEMIEIANGLVKRQVVTNAFFTKFVVQ